MGDKLKLYFKDMMELLEWRESIIEELMDALKDSNKMKKDYSIRLHEIIWLKSKVKKIIENRD